MTNHSEATGSSENGDITGPQARGGHAESGGAKPGSDGAGLHAPSPAYDGHGGEHQVTLRTPAELADALPYLLGYRPEDSIVLVALHDRDGRGRFGGRARLGIPASADDWPSAARQLAHGLVKGSERRGARPESMVAFLCQEPEKGQTGQQVMERLRPLAHKLRVECGSLDVVVVEALCISEGRYWSYCCDNDVCCPREGAPMGLPGTSVLAAAATYAGIQVRGTLRELRARLLPWENAAALEQETALDTASMALVPRILDDAGRAEVADETLDLAGKILDRFAEARPVSGMLLADLRDDELLGHDEAARLILGLQDRATRDRAAEWMEGDEAACALRLWRTLARRCVGPYGEHAAAPLTLAGWVAWSTGDELEAREALAMALGADPDYLFARLLHQACNEGLDPESIRTCLRAEREGRGRAGADGSGTRAVGVGPRVDGAEPRVDGAGAGVDGAEPRVEGAEPRVDGAAAWVDGARVRMDGAEPQVNGVGPRLDGSEPRADGSERRGNGTAALAADTATGAADTATGAADTAARAGADHAAGRGPTEPGLEPHPEQSGIKTQPEPSMPEPSPTAAPSRRRRRSRPAGASGGAPGRARAADRDPSPRTSHRRTPTGTTRPAGAAEADTRPGRATAAGPARSGSARTGGTRARAARQAAVPCQDTGRKDVQPGHSTEGEE
ncbi:DUF4192 domain-containing protein [Streptomyces lomondensis]|uniref:DUF4192 domain-containing protein n=1 Tax=Streptomyces lomondensis TaxID=68229 RepID=A0ABQ2XP01_9ACTN|nr:DUF4192 domain-containing protein [Streptomyces lomondensis]MCF0082095.1 DUF4192 domain-containing protein [Streptomyces lomondensis]GGX27236.1 hypothetical protein GCM10010383_67270 [Streptomyces lomondensis]